MATTNPIPGITIEINGYRGWRRSFWELLSPEVAERVKYDLLLTAWIDAHRPMWTWQVAD